MGSEPWIGFAKIPTRSLFLRFFGIRLPGSITTGIVLSSITKLRLCHTILALFQLPVLFPAVLETIAGPFQFRFRAGQFLPRLLQTL